MNLSIVLSDSDTEPITAADAKTHLQIEHTADDSYITLLITAARTRLERWLGRALMEQTITLDLDAWEAQGPIVLPRAPFSSLTSFVYYDSDGNSTAVDSTTYYVSGDDPASVVPQNGGWLIKRGYKSHRIVYVAGYGDEATNVPEDLRQALRVMVADMWNNPESMKLESRSSSFPTALPTAALNLAAPYRRIA